MTRQEGYYWVKYDIKNNDKWRPCFYEVKRKVWLTPFAGFMLIGGQLDEIDEHRIPTPNEVKTK